MSYRVAAIQMNSGHHVQKNLVTAEKLIAEAAAQGAQLIVLPEMFAVMAMDQVDKIKMGETLDNGPIQAFLSQQALRHRVWLVGGTIPLAVPNVSEKIHAACLVFDDQGKRVARYDKIHLFDVSLNAARECYNESRAVTAGHEVIVVTTPFGKLGLAVCYDVRFPELFRAMHEQQVQLVALPAAFTFTTGTVHWDILVRARAIENQVYMIAAAQSGTHENGRKTYGHSMIVDPWGAVKACLPEGQGIVITDIDFQYLQKIRDEFPVLSHRRV
ncbi:MAG: hypothetical protein ACD_45C00473G0022 [uncultured bacterium]|nr:MAG: hypothetical protein ACD_45C00473G0022 [uncultured bacterium]